MNTLSLLNPCKNNLKSFCQLTKARWKIKIEAWALSGRPTLLKRLGPSKQCCINFPQEKVVEKVWDKKLTISYDPSFVYFFMEICCWWTRDHPLMMSDFRGGWGGQANWTESDKDRGLFGKNRTSYISELVAAFL